MNKPLLVVLDIDETLIHSSDHKLDRDADFRVDYHHVYKRPGVDAFLSAILSNPGIKVAVWTWAEEDYATATLRELGVDTSQLVAVFTRGDCVKKESVDEARSHYGYEIIKDLKKMSKKTGWPLERMIAIDDKPRFYQRQYSNLLAVRPFVGKEEQPDLFPALLATIGRLQGLDNVRPVEKRGWYSQSINLMRDDSPCP